MGSGKSVERVALKQQAAGGGRWLTAYLYGLEPSQLPSLQTRKEVWR